MTPQRPSWLSRTLAKLFKRKEPPPPAYLAVEESGFAIIDGEARKSVRWADVKEVFAFKRDIFSVDLICIGFRVTEEGGYVEIDEEMRGYDEVAAIMAEAFPGLGSAWWEKVAFPAFKTNFLSIWGEPKMAAIWELKRRDLAPDAS